MEAVETIIIENFQLMSAEALRVFLSLRGKSIDRDFEALPKIDPGSRPLIKWG